jgi:hypothetical protein
MRGRELLIKGVFQNFQQLHLLLILLSPPLSPSSFFFLPVPFSI